MLLKLGSKGFKVGLLTSLLGMEWSTDYNHTVVLRVMDFQREVGLLIDGKVGNNTYNALLEETGLLIKNKKNNVVHKVTTITKSRKDTNELPVLPELKKALNLLFYGHNKQQLEDYLDSAYPWFSKIGIYTKNDFICCFGQFREEVGPRMQLTESFNYTPNALFKVFKYYRSRSDEAIKDGRAQGKVANQKTIASKVYANRLGNGSIKSKEGWLYRGKSFGMVTGKSNVTAVDKLFKKLHIPNICGSFIHSPNCRNKNKYAILIGLAFWYDKKCYLLTNEINTQNINKITAKFNFYTSSYKKRVQHTKHLNNIMRKM